MVTVSAPLWDGISSVCTAKIFRKVPGTPENRSLKTPVLSAESPLNAHPAAADPVRVMSHTCMNLIQPMSYQADRTGELADFSNAFDRLNVNDVRPRSGKWRKREAGIGLELVDGSGLLFYFNERVAVEGEC